MMATTLIEKGSHGWIRKALLLFQKQPRGPTRFELLPGLREFSSCRNGLPVSKTKAVAGIHGKLELLQCGNRSAQQVQIASAQYVATASELCAVEIVDDMTAWQEKTDFLVSCGLSKDQALRVIRQCPLLLPMAVEGELHPKIAFLKSLGVSDLPKVIVFSPNLLLCKTESTLMPKAVFFESLGIQRQSIGKIIERYPTVLTYSVEGNMTSKTKFLASIGLDRENVAKVVMRSPCIFALSIKDNMGPKVELLQSIGVDKKLISKLITRCPKIFCLSNEDNILPKIKYLESVGVLKESMGKIVATCPSILNLSVTHIQKKLDFLQENNYCVQKVVNEFPAYLTYSLEHRIKPRHRVISCLRELGLLQRDYSLCFILHISQRQFVRDFVRSHPQGDSLYITS